MTRLGRVRGLPAATSGAPRRQPRYVVWLGAAVVGVALYTLVARRFLGALQPPASASDAKPRHAGDHAVRAITTTPGTASGTAVAPVAIHDGPIGAGNVPQEQPSQHLRNGDTTRGAPLPPARGSIAGAPADAASRVADGHALQALPAAAAEAAPTPPPAPAGLRDSRGGDGAVSSASSESGAGQEVANGGIGTASVTSPAAAALDTQPPAPPPSTPAAPPAPAEPGPLKPAVPIASAVASTEDSIQLSPRALHSGKDLTPVASFADGAFRCWADRDSSLLPRYQAFCFAQRVCARRLSEAPPDSDRWEFLMPREWQLPASFHPRFTDRGQQIRTVPASELEPPTDPAAPRVGASARAWVEDKRVFFMSYYKTKHFSSWNDAPLFLFAYQLHAAEFGLPAADVFLDRSFETDSAGTQTWKNGLRRLLVAHAGVTVALPKDHTCFPMVFDVWGPLEPDAWLPFGAPERADERSILFGPAVRRPVMHPWDGVILSYVMGEHLKLVDEIRWNTDAERLSPGALAVALAWRHVAEAAVGRGVPGPPRDGGGRGGGGGQDAAWQAHGARVHKLTKEQTGEAGDTQVRHDLWMPDVPDEAKAQASLTLASSGLPQAAPALVQTSFATLAAAALARANRVYGSGAAAKRRKDVHIGMLERPADAGRAYVDGAGLLHCASDAVEGAGFSLTGTSRMSFEPPTSFEDQVSLVEEVDVWISAHGAGSVNNQWLRPCGVHLEIFSYNHFSPNFHGMAAEALNLVYAYIHERSEPVQSCIPEDLRPPGNSYKCLFQDPHGYACRLCVRGGRNIAASCDVLTRVLQRALVRRRQCLRELRLGLPPGLIHGHMFASWPGSVDEWLVSHEIHDAAAFDETERRANELAADVMARARRLAAGDGASEGGGTDESGGGGGGGGAWAGPSAHLHDDDVVAMAAALNDGEGLYYHVPTPMGMHDASANAVSLARLMESPLVDVATAPV